jgi:bifunctional DNA-binding transcriptional regulator/antitoxin component of YhaV-PrlF toxin-antitoxin module
MVQNIAEERILGIVKVQEVGGTTYTVAIPKSIREKLNIKKGQMMYAKVDEKGRIIYNPLTNPILSVSPPALKV